MGFIRFILHNISTGYMAGKEVEVRRKKIRNCLKVRFFCSFPKEYSYPFPYSSSLTKPNIVMLGFVRGLLERDRSPKDGYIGQESRTYKSYLPSSLEETIKTARFSVPHGYWCPCGSKDCPHLIN